MNRASSSSTMSLRSRIMLRALGIPLAILGLFGLFTLVNSVGLADEQIEASVRDKQIYEAGTRYHTRIVGGRPWISADDMPELSSLILDAEGEQLVAYVSPQQYDQLNVGDRVTLRVRRTRLTRFVEVVQIQQLSDKGR